MQQQMGGVVVVGVLQPATATTALLPGAVGGDGSAILNPADLHASTGQSSAGTSSHLCN